MKKQPPPERFTDRWYAQCKIVKDTTPDDGDITWYAVHSPSGQMYLDENDLCWKDQPQVMAGWFPSEQAAREALANVELRERMNPLSFKELSHANTVRGRRWKKPGQPSPSLAFAMVELAGEVGEACEAAEVLAFSMLSLARKSGKACNIAKKLARHEMGMAGGSADVRPLIDELADVVICVSLVANKLGIDLGEAVARKFNATSEKHGFPVKLPEVKP